MISGLGRIDRFRANIKNKLAFGHMESFILFFVILALHTYVFMFQRATLTIARVIEILPIAQVQVILTPNWVGAIGWMSTIGLYASIVYIWLQHGLLLAVGAFIVSHLLTAVVPIPSSYFYNLVLKHLAKEISHEKDNEKKEIYIGLQETVKKISENYRVT